MSSPPQGGALEDIYILLFVFRPPCVRNKGYYVHSSDTISIQNSAFDGPCVFLFEWCLSIIFYNSDFVVQARKSKAACKFRAEEVELRLLQSCGCAQTIDLVMSSTNNFLTFLSVCGNNFRDRSTFAFDVY